MEKVLDFNRFLNEKEGSGFFSKLFKKGKDPKPEEIKKEDEAESAKKKMEDECKGSKYKAFGEAKSVKSFTDAVSLARSAAFVNLQNKLEKDDKSLLGEDVEENVDKYTEKGAIRLFQMKSDGSYVAYSIAELKKDSYDELPKKVDVDKKE